APRTAVRRDIGRFVSRGLGGSVAGSSSRFHPGPRGLGDSVAGSSSRFRPGPRGLGGSVAGSSSRFRNTIGSSSRGGAVRVA
ncbi:MAG: hypothetical protein J6Y80_00600, partial [Victivallales bacterium]|nr:hypothetical protein [Victivallales bacterium]